MKEWMVVWFINQLEAGRIGGTLKPRGHASPQRIDSRSQWKLPDE